MRVAIHQPNYIPWMGFFRKIALSDAFVFFDDVQFEKGGYTNRVKINIGGNESWLTQPVVKSNILGSKISDLEFSDQFDWKKAHLKTIYYNYSRCKFFNETRGIIEAIYSNNAHRISEFNINAIKEIISFLNIDTKLYKSSELDYPNNQSATMKIIAICKILNASTYISGKGAINYSEDEMFESANLAIEYTAPLLDNLTSLGGLSIIDAISNFGSEKVRQALCAI